jgi:hypothetical protein
MCVFDFRDLGYVWTAPWQELFDVLQQLVGCGHVSGLLVRQVWPLALMRCADRVPNKNAHSTRGALTQAGSPDPRNDRICITSSCPRRFVEAPDLSCCWQQSWFLERLCADHHGPGHASNLIGKRNSGGEQDMTPEGFRNSGPCRAKQQELQERESPGYFAQIP